MSSNPFERISARDIAVSGLQAQRTRMTLIANNVANAMTTRTPEGGAFRRQMVLLRGVQAKSGDPGEKLGVFVKKIVPDESPLRKVYDPSSPDADKEGYVEYPNVNLPVEMMDLVSAQRAYEANIAVLATDSKFKQQALDLLQ